MFVPAPHGYLFSFSCRFRCCFRCFVSFVLRFLISFLFHLFRDADVAFVVDNGVVVNVLADDDCLSLPTALLPTLLTPKTFVDDAACC